MIKNPPANVRETGLTPDQHAAEQLSPCAITTEPEF